MGNLVVAFFIVCCAVYCVIEYHRESEFAKERRRKAEWDEERRKAKWAEEVAAACHEAERERMVPIRGSDGRRYYVEREDVDRLPDILDN